MFIVHCTFLFSCSTNRLPTDQFLLYDQQVRGNQAIESDELLALLPQRPNKSFILKPFTVSLWIYQGQMDNYRPDSARRELETLTARFEQESQTAANDPKALRKLNRRFARKARKLQQYIEEGNGLMRNFGEPPVYYTAADAQSNAEKIRLYLLKKGFFRAKTSFTVDSSLSDRRVRVTYLINEDVPYQLTAINYQIPDRRIDSLVGSSLGTSTLKIGTRYDGDKIDQEIVRIETYLRNNGYYGFSRRYFNVDYITDTAAAYLDTTNKAFQPVDLVIRLANPPGQSAHPVFRVGDVRVTVARDPALPLDTIRQNGIAYFLEHSLYNSRLLGTKISLRPDSLYRQTDYTNTQRQLFLLNQFRFSNVNITDTTNRRLRVAISATPLDRYDFTLESGATGLYQNTSLFPGGFGNATLRVRNWLGGLETFETSVRYGVEAQTGFAQIENVYFSRELGITTSFTFPQILFPSRARFRFNALNPRTQLSLGYTNTLRPDYSRTNFRLAMTYLWQKNLAQQFSFGIADINLLLAGSGRDATETTLFQQFLRDETARGSTLETSFRRAFFSNVNFAYTYNTNILGENQRANFFRITTESGGTTLNLLNREATNRLGTWINGLSGQQSDSISLFKYLRANVDYRHYLPIGRTSLVAFRVNAGLLFGYGANRTAPYEKRFFAGGANSVRAWLPRRLGLGAAFPESTSLTNGESTPLFRTDNNGNPVEGGQFDYRFERPGDVLLEGSAEVRGRLLRFGNTFNINGAFFIDAGNVWLLRNLNPNAITDNVERSVFRPGEFLSQIAVGTGVGLRFDFNFLVIRFDAAAKVYDPSRRYTTQSGQRVDERFILPRFTFADRLNNPNPMVLNFGIGYPF